jgi:hypothetical protein
VDGEVAAPERRSLVREETADDVDRLLESVHSFLVVEERNSVRVMFVDLPAGPDPESETTVGDAIDGGRRIGEYGGMANRGRRHQRSEADSSRHGSEGGDHRPDLVDVTVGNRSIGCVGHEVIRVPEAMPRAVVDEFGEATEFGPRPFGRRPYGEHRHGPTLVSRLGSAPVDLG